MDDAESPTVPPAHDLGATRLQSWVRKIIAQRLVNKLKQELSKQLAEIQSHSGLVVGKKRVQPWSEESAQLALSELNGKLGKNGVIYWPKGTVEKLLIERTKYADMIKESKRAEARSKQAAAMAAETARQAVIQVKQELRRLQDARRHELEGCDPSWTILEWVESLQVTNVLGIYLMEELKKAAGSDQKFEKAFITKLGTSTLSEGVMIVKGLLEPTDGDRKSFVETLSEKIANGAINVTQEMIKAKKDREKDDKPQLVGKFFDETPSDHTATSFRLVFGDRKDFVAGLAGLVGKPDPVSLSAGMKHDHVGQKDSKHEFTTGNYGVTTTSEIEYWFVVDPSAAKLAELNRQEWPIETKLVGDEATKKLCRKPRPMSGFDQARKKLMVHLKPLCVKLTDEMFIGARLYTGPAFVKYNTILRAVPGQIPYFTKQMEELTLGNLYTTTLHVINQALTTLSNLSKCQKVYRGVSGGMLPPSFNEPSAIDNFKGGIEYAFSASADLD